MKSGSGLVHIAPSHGQEDFEAYTTFMSSSRPNRAVEYLDLVDDLGTFKNEADRPWMRALKGKEVFGDGSRHVINLIQQQKRLLGSEVKIRHKYPYDWRTKQPVITR